MQPTKPYRGCGRSPHHATISALNRPGRLTPADCTGGAGKRNYKMLTVRSQGWNGEADNTTLHFRNKSVTNEHEHTVHKMNTDNFCSRRKRRVRKPDGTTFRLRTSGNCGSWELYCVVLGSSGVLFWISLIIMHGTKFNNTASKQNACKLQRQCGCAASNIFVIYFVKSRKPWQKKSGRV